MSSTLKAPVPPLAVVPLQEVQESGISQNGITQYLEINRNETKEFFKTTLIFNQSNWFQFLALSQSAYLSGTQIGDLTDSVNYKIDIGDNFTSGDTISSYEMNERFNILKNIVEQIINNGNGINIPNNLNYITTEGFKDVYSTSNQKSVGQGSINLANTTCNDDGDRATIENNSEKVCSNVKGLYYILVKIVLAICIVMMMDHFIILMVI